MSVTRLVDKILVRSNSPASRQGILRYNEMAIPCALGFGGIAAGKKEGDGVSPAGKWPLRRILYRADRIGEIVSELPAHALTPEQGWCDAPNNENYNCQVTMPYPASAEKLWRQDGLYDVIVVLGYNDAPVIHGKGSAIFLHIARSGYLPTQGCVAISLPHMKDLLRCCGPDTTMQIVA